MSTQPRGPDGSLDPDVSEEELGTAIDNAVPTHGYQKHWVVGLGGSAGSLDALRRFFAAMPSNSGMSFIVIVHLAPEHGSLLSEILQRSCVMPVGRAVDGEELKQNHVYVIPPGKSLTLVDGRLRLSPLPREPGRRMTVDLFFRSLADTHGPHAVAVVLSGGDGDGAVGIKRIKERGGLTIAQDPASAEHAGMPQAAIGTNMVDWVLAAEDIPVRLLEYHEREQRLRVPPESGPNPAIQRGSTSDSDEVALREVLTFLCTRTGRDFSYYKRATIVRRVARRMQVNGLEDLTSYLAFLRTHPGESGALLQDLLISVTNFFRDREAFDALEAMIPELFRDKSQSDTIRIWVPACATGEEAYSIAMLLSEHARTLDAPPSLQIFATDLDEAVLLEGRNGLYPDAIATDVAPERLRRFFVKEHHGYRVRRELREMLLFAVHDLLKDSPFSRLDLISCRNLLIYLNRDAQQRVFDIFHFALREEGKLFLGTSESVDDGSHLFRALDKKHRIYTTRSGARVNLPVPVGASTLARALLLQKQPEPAVSLATKNPAQSRIGSPVPPPGAHERLSWSELHLSLLERIGPPSLIIDQEHEILHLSESVSPFLQFSGGEPSTNLLRVIHPRLRVELRAALFRARQTGQPTLAEALPIMLRDQERLVDLRVSPASELSSEFMLVSFELRAPSESALVPRVERDEPAVRHLERELEQSKSHLRDLVEQHEASTEELKASNEELQAMNEELRSATEELETSREELQSINEELTTVNQELKSKVEELGHANSDLHNLMGATAIATVFLDRDLRITRFTPPAVDLFNLIPTDVGRPLADLQHRLEYADLLDDAGRVLRLLVPVEREVTDVGGRSFLARLLPYRTIEDRIAGVVLTFVDITERQAARAATLQVQRDMDSRVEQLTSALQQESAGHERAEKQRRALQRLVLQAQEQERSRISRELHDEIGQQLTALMLQLKGLEGRVPEPAVQASLRELRHATEQVATDVHRVSVELRPAALDSFGLGGAITTYLESWFARTGIPVDFVNTGVDDARLPSPIETALYRIVQEAMNNVYKHAQAKSVAVTLERRGDHLLATVEDDGVSFDVDALSREAVGSRIGVVGMRERAAMLGGELSIESSPGRGTRVHALIPLAASVFPAADTAD